MNPPKGIDPKVWEMAREAINEEDCEEGYVNFLHVNVARAIQKNIEAEREGCAKLADALKSDRKKLQAEEESENGQSTDAEIFGSQAFMCRVISQAIRNRSNTTTERNEG